MTTAEAFAVLQTDRPALFETPLSRGRRHPATLGRVVVDELVVVRIPAPAPRGVFPGATDIRVSVPDGERLWSFACGVLSSMHAHGSLLAVLRWPTRAELLPGRSAPRAELVLPVRYRSRRGTTGSGWIGSYTLDVSSTGMRFASPVDVQAGDQLEVQIGLGGDSIAAEASVAWQRKLPTEVPAPPFVAGARFEGIPDIGRRRLETLVEEHLARAA